MTQEDDEHGESASERERFGLRIGRSANSALAEESEGLHHLGVRRPAGGGKGGRQTSEESSGNQIAG